MTLEDTYRYLVGAYFGIREMDEYSLKEYMLYEIENYIIDFLKDNPINNFDYYKEAEKINDNVSLKNKLQDSLIILPKINAPIELILLVKKRIKKLEK